MKRLIFTVFTLFVGLVAGFGLSNWPAGKNVQAQASEVATEDKVLIQGHARAISAVAPPGEQFTLTVSGKTQGGFNIVPKGKKFILTDVLYQSQRSVQQNIVVNIARADPSRKTHAILFQVTMAPEGSEQIQLCSGYEIPAGQALTAFTGGGYDPGQFVSISATGYLVDE